MSFEVEVIQQARGRILILVCDTEQEKTELVQKAIDKGWTYYQEGTVPDTDRLSVWLTKPLNEQTPTQGVNSVN